MSEQELFILADQSLNTVVQRITDNQWGVVLPSEFARRGTSSITLREIINYHAYDDAWIPDMVAGKTMEEAGKDNYQGDLLGDTPKENFATLVKTACEAVKQLDDLKRTVHCSYGDYSAQEFLWQVTYFRGLRVYDLAKVLGQSTKLPNELVEGITHQIAPHAEEWRKIGVFGPQVEVPTDASAQDKLLGLTGRDPKA